ncbi:putative repeat protein (TIGR01451 family) [Hymenobacter sp. UYAg731]
MKPLLRLLLLLLAWTALLRPGTAQAQCAQTNTLDYTTATAGDRKTTTETISGTSFTYSGYNSTSPTVRTFAVGTIGNLSGTSLIWQENSQNTDPNTASITLTFTRPVSNLSFVIQDLDSDPTTNFTDNLKLDGFPTQSGGTAATLTAANFAFGADNKFVSPNTVQGTAAAAAGDTKANVTITFSTPVQRLVLTYFNTYPYAVNVTRQQTIGINTISWCAQADLTTTLAAVSPVTAGTTAQFNVTFANTGELAIAGNTTPYVQLPAGLTNIAATNGGVYNPANFRVEYPGTTAKAANSTFSSAITFTAPTTGSVAATSNITSATAETPDQNPNTANASIAVTPIVLSGRVYEDANYGGGSGRAYAAAAGYSLRPGVLVELYSNANVYLGSTITDASGNYSFNVPSAATYKVRVLNSSVTSGRPGATFTTAAGGYRVSTEAAVQTYNGTTTRVGGEEPSKTDAAANTGAQTLTALTPGGGTTTPESLATLAVTTSGLTNQDFGFNFDLVVNTNDAGQGSLRQFITNSNTLTNAGLAQVGQTAGKEASIFMISDGRTTGTIPAGTRSGVNGGAASGGVATIMLSTTLPNITDANTTITGLTQTALYGNTSLPIAEVTTGPEVIVNFNGQSGLTVAATGTNASIISLGLTGTLATGGSTTGALSILATGAVVQDNTMNNNGANMRINGVGGATVTGNVFRDALANNSDGIELTTSANNTITNNQFLNNAGYGIDFIAGANDGNTISGNLFKNNGQLSSNGQTAGIGIRSNSSNNTISNNTFTANIGDGITVLQGVNNVISQNSFFGNGDLAIDLAVASGTAYQGDGVTLNDSGDADGTGATASGNGLFNSPVIQSATIRNGNLVITGFATANSVVEIYVSDNFTTTPGFGEGKTYLASRTEGSAADADAGTGTYAANVNGLNQGTETGQRRFTFSIPLSSLTAAQLTELNATNAKLTATATLATLTNGNQGTSEFSGTAAVLAAPTANNDFATTTANPAAPITFSAIANDTPADGSLVGTTINLNPNNIAGQSATTFTVAGQGTFTTVGVAVGSVKFTPANLTFTGNVTIPYVISNSEGVVSNQANLTVSVTPVLDLVTAITAPANNGSVTAGAALSYTVTAQNASAIAASNVTQTLQLVPGLTSNGGLVTFTINGSASLTPTYDNATGLVNFTPTAIALAANTTNTYVANFTKAPASGPVTATANIGSTAGSNGPELNRTNNFATNTVNITPSYDVSTTITGSVNAAGLPASVVSGALVTYLVRTTNAAASASPAPGVIQTVTFDGNLTVAADGTTTGLYISNGGTAAYNSGTNKTVVTFPTLSTLPIGQTVTNTISFAAPALVAPATTFTYSATANVQANGAATPGAANPGDTNTAPAAGSNDVATVSTTVIAPVGTPANVYTTISSDKTVTTAGTTVTLTVVAGNRGAGTAANVLQQVQLPAGLAGVTVGNGTYDSATGIVTFTNIATLAPQGTNPLPFTIQFTAPASGPVLATATVREANADPVPADNVAEVKVDITTTTDVSTTLAGPATATVGQAVTYAVTTANTGINTAFNVVQTVQLPAGLNANGGVTFAGTTAGTYDNATGVATFLLASPLAAGSRQVNNLTFSLPASVITDPSGATTGSNQLALLAGVRTSTTETSSTNNSATTITAVTPAADVTVAVSGPALALAGSPVTFAVTTTNNGPVPVASIVSTLQLPAGLTTSGGTVLVNGTAAGASYDNTTGLITFATATNLPTGGSVANTVTVQMPDVTQLVPVARAQVGSATIDTNLDNNRADAITTITNTAVVGAADLSTSISIAGGVSTILPGASVTLNATFTNLAGGITATNVVPRLQLPAGLANGGNGVTVAGGTGGVYNNTTGLVTWNTVPSLASGAAALTGYNVTFKAPASGTVTGTSFVASATADAVATNNANSTTLTVTSQVDVTTSVKGPVAALTGSRVTYAVVTANNGPSPSGVVTQTVTIPATATNISFPAGSTQAPASGGTITITFPLINAMSVTPAGDVVNYVSFDAPNASYTVSATASTPGDTNTGNNTVATPFATAVDQTPTAYDVVNTLPSFLTGVIGSTAGPIKISPLTGTDADAGQTATLTYTLTSLPAANTGILYLDAAGTTPALAGVGYTAAQIANLYFNPRGTILATDPTYVGNVTFGYITTDTPGLTSAPALYTIAVGKDEKSTAVSSATKGRTVKYQNLDVVVNLIDVNTVKYNTDGSLPFGKYLADRSVNPTPANGGLTSVVQTGGTLAAGLALDAATGQIYVLDRTAIRSGTYSITVTTIDANGGTNTLTYSYTIGDFPLPVELTDFTASAVKNLDAALLWHTAQEKNNDHFDVERSLNGTDFVKIGEVKGQGSKTTPTEYALTDAGIGPKAKGLVYYRLKQVDTDGETSYSPVRPVTFTTALVPAITLFPNPATTGTQLDLSQLPTGRYQVSVLDATGRIVLNTTLEAGLAHALDLNTIASGTYNVLVRGQSNGQTINLTKRLIKE